MKKVARESKKSQTKGKRISMPDIQYGDVDLSEEDLEPKNVRWRVTMNLDLDLLDAIRLQATKEGKPYQTWINDKLREVVLGEESLATRLAALEAEVFKKRA